MERHSVSSSVHAFVFLPRRRTVPGPTEGRAGSGGSTFPLFLALFACRGWASVSPSGCPVSRGACALGPASLEKGTRPSGCRRTHRGANTTPARGQQWDPRQHSGAVSARRSGPGGAAEGRSRCPRSLLIATEGRARAAWAATSEPSASRSVGDGSVVGSSRATFCV